MKQGTHIFIAATLLFATGTSAIGYSLAQESARAGSLQPAFSLIDLSAPPWYCVAVTGPLKAQAEEDPGYYQRAENRRAPEPPARTPGYGTPGYVPPPGYIAPPSRTPGYMGEQPPGPPAISTDVATEEGITQKLLSSTFPFGLVCPDGYALDTQNVSEKCLATLQMKLNGDKKIAKAPDVYAACKKVVKAEAWDAKISKKICAKFYQYEKDCATAQTKGKKCVPLATYISKAGVKKKDSAQAQQDAIYWCNDVFPLQ